MRISGTEYSSVILSQTKKFKTLKNEAKKLPKQAKAKRDGVKNPQNYNFNQLISMLSNATNQHKSNLVSTIKIILNCNFVVLLHYPFWQQPA